MQSMLNDALGWHPPLKMIIDPDGNFGGCTKDGVALFQYRYGLPISGIVDLPTWDMLEKVTAPGPLLSPAIVNNLDPWNAEEPQADLVDIATPYIGATEAKNNKMGSDSRMKEIFEADDLAEHGKTDGYAWCCSFVSLCVQKLIANHPYCYGEVKPPREPSVSNFLDQWATRAGCLIFKPSSSVIQAMPGDIVVFTFSHIGIVTSAGNRIAETIEGNTNVAGSREGIAVMEKSRPYSQIRSFIRLPVRRLLL